MQVGRPSPSPSMAALEKTTSLYQQCFQVIQKLYSLPGFEKWLFPSGLRGAKRISVHVSQLSSLPIDPVETLWDAFRLGSPLSQLYNLLSPRKPLELVNLLAGETAVSEDGKINNKCKAAVYHFLIACKTKFNFSDDELFTITELYRNDTNGFVKVLKTVTLLLEKIERAGLLPAKLRPLPFAVPADIENPADNREKVIMELVNTERTYLAALEKLQSYRNELETQEIISREVSHKIFLNLDDLLDFQRRLLVALEGVLAFPSAEQRFGQVFIANEEGFRTYEPFCANFKAACEIAGKWSDDLSKLAHVIEPKYELSSYLIKPTQRVCKYPLLFRELIKNTDSATYGYLDELEQAQRVIENVTERINDATRRAENRTLKTELESKVEDWKGLNSSEFGDLLLNDKFLMSSDAGDREYHLYLFQRVLLCCKDARRKKGALALKGNIYLSSITSVVDSSNSEGFALKVFWRDGSDMESFLLKCRNEEQVRLWKEKFTRIIDGERSRRRSNASHNASFMRKSQYIQDSSDGALSPGDSEDSHRFARPRSSSTACSESFIRGRKYNRDSVNSKRSSTSSNRPRSLSPPPRARTSTPPPPLPPLPLNVRLSGSPSPVSAYPQPSLRFASAMKQSSTSPSSVTSPLPRDAHRFASKSLPPPPRQRTSAAVPSPSLLTPSLDDIQLPPRRRPVTEITEADRIPVHRRKNSEEKKTLATTLPTPATTPPIPGRDASVSAGPTSSSSSTLASTIADLERELAELGVDLGQ